MSQVIQQELEVFLLSVLHGIVLIFVYDLLRAARRAFPHNLTAISVEDFLFWIMAGFLTFCLAFLKTDGVIRGYVAAGIVLGAVFYHASFSTFVVKYVSNLLYLFKRSVHLIWKILSVPVKKAWRATKKGIVFIGKKGYNKLNRQTANRSAEAKAQKRERIVRPSAKGSREKHCNRNTSEGVRWNGKKKKACKQK